MKRPLIACIPFLHSCASAEVGTVDQFSVAATTGLALLMSFVVSDILATLMPTSRLSQQRPRAWILCFGLCTLALAGPLAWITSELLNGFALVTIGVSIFFVLRLWEQFVQLPASRSES